jgi:hypothetical protein
MTNTTKVPTRFDYTYIQLTPNQKPIKLDNQVRLMWLKMRFMQLSAPIRKRLFKYLQDDFKKYLIANGYRPNSF